MKKWKMIKANISDSDRNNLKIQAIKQQVTVQALVGKVLKDYLKCHSNSVTGPRKFNNISMD